MIRPSPAMQVYLCVEPVDMRKQAATLGLIVEQELGRGCSMAQCTDFPIAGVIW